jgi:hypothetical protein
METSSLRILYRSCPGTSTKLNLHEFSFWAKNKINMKSITVSIAA